MFPQRAGSAPRRFGLSDRSLCSGPHLSVYPQFVLIVSRL